jgi:putative membrane protein insertion efficiency factor
MRTGDSWPGLAGVAAQTPRRALIGIVRMYQVTFSAVLGPRCRYYPSCSSYAVTALRLHGAVRGAGLAAWRLVRCNPWSLGGVDYVPGDPSGRAWAARDGNVMKALAGVGAGTERRR